MLVNGLSALNRAKKGDESAANSDTSLYSTPKSAPKSTPQTRFSAPVAVPLPDLASVPRTEWPKEVKIKEAMKFVTASGSLSLPAGTIVKLDSLSGDTVSLTMQGARATAKAEATDAAERIRDARKAAQDAENAKQKAAVEQIRSATERAERAKAEMEAAEAAELKKMEAEIGKKPQPQGWEREKPPFIVQMYLKRILKDPDSVQYIETYSPVVSTYNGQKCWALKFKYRAKNSFGAYGPEIGTAYLLNDNLIGYK